ncbi:hypothetical protein [Pseudonocardia sp. ICBG1293]|uniref:Rv1733c family protein n=1 Tax=Pseudonocardia sp. ICBG1293 TaxID=2844382 RepID=UPI001CC94E24|nr:hypothetical protein [Pseudonocardia sp. ICBG1293]
MRAGDPTGPADRLRRRACRREDLLAVLLGLLAATGLLVAWLAGAAAHGSVLERGAVEAHQRVPVAATVASRVSAVGDLQTGQQALTLSWTGPDGLPHTGGSTLPGMYDVGDRVQAWVGPDGRLAPPPSTPADAVTVAVAAGFVTAVVWAAGVLAAGRLVFAWNGRAFARAWEQDWAAVEPGWSGRRTP